MNKSVTHDMFPSDEASNLSKSFTVEDSNVMIQVKGWDEGDYATLEYWFGDDCDGCWEPFTPGCCVEGFGCPTNTYFLQVPGKYRILLENEDENHLNDDAWFEDVQIQVVKFKNNLDYSKGSC